MNARSQAQPRPNEQETLVICDWTSSSGDSDAHYIWETDGSFAILTCDSQGQHSDQPVGGKAASLDKHERGVCSRPDLGLAHIPPINFHYVKLSHMATHNCTAEWEI